MRSYTSALVASFASALLVAPTAFAQVQISPSQSVGGAGSVVSNTINPSYAGFGIEPSDLFVYTGNTTANPLTYHLLNNLAGYTGAPPHIRVGGNAGDTMLYDPSITAYTLVQNADGYLIGGNRPSANYWLFGDNYFKVMDYFPKGTPLTYGLNLAYTGSDALQRIVQQANAAFTNIGNSSSGGSHLYSLEIGNEPDLYIDLGYRSQDWSPTDFGNEWASRAEAIYNQTLQQRNISSNFFEVACTATTASKNGQPFRIANLVGNTQGVAIDNGIYVAGWNQHDYFYYLGVSKNNITLYSLLDLSRTPHQFIEWAGQVGQAETTGKPYYLREMGSIGPNGLQGISDTFGNALWTLNFFFYAATIGIDSVQMHMTQYSYAAPWQTNNFNNEGPHVRPTYYAWAAWAQIIGPTCNSQIAPLTLNNQPGSYTNRLGAYGVYRAGDLTSVVMFNTQLYYANSGNANYQNFALSLPSLAGKTVYLYVLYADGVDSTSDIQWNGLSYEQSGTGQASTVNGTQWTMTVGSDGSLNVAVRDSQVVVVSTVRLGHETVNAQACKKLATSGVVPGSGTSNGKAAPTFKATSGFKGELPISKTAIIAIAAGGGAFLIALCGLFIWCCVRSCKKSKARKARNVAILKAPPRNDDLPLLDKSSGDDSHASYPAYQNSPALKGWESPMTSISHGHQVQPSQSWQTGVEPEYYNYAPYQYSPRAQLPTPPQAQQQYQTQPQQPGHLHAPSQNNGRSQYGNSQYSRSQYAHGQQGHSQYNNSQYGNSQYGGSQYGNSQSHGRAY